MFRNLFEIFVQLITVEETGVDKLGVDEMGVKQYVRYTDLVNP